MLSYNVLRVPEAQQHVCAIRACVVERHESKMAFSAAKVFCCGYCIVVKPKQNQGMSTSGQQWAICMLVLFVVVSIAQRSWRATLRSDPRSHAYR